MADKSKIEQARAMFLKNPFWKEIYEKLMLAAHKCENGE